MFSASVSRARHRNEKVLEHVCSPVALPFDLEQTLGLAPIALIDLDQY